jgi:hypothetical protein
MDQTRLVETEREAVIALALGRMSAWVTSNR